jgi:DNA repair exonuclease SbcCD ATPase subunit
LSSIQKKISEELIKHMEELRQRQQKVKEDKGKLTEVLKELKRLKKALEEYRVKLDETKKQFYEITGCELAEPVLSSIGGQIDELGKNIDEHNQRIEEFNTRLNELKRAQSIIENLALVEKKINEALGVSGSSAELSEALLNHVESEKEELEKLRLICERIEEFDEKINLLEDIATLFRRSASLNGLNKSLKEIDQKLLTQQEKLHKLQELIEALTDIRDAINSVKMEALEEILSTIRDDLNAIYSRLLGHPFFIKLQLIPEEERGTHIYRIIAQSKGEAYTTYVRTRFSQTQKNLVAISLFLAMAKRSPARLVILDDPSQSLDLEHKKALVEVLQALMEDVQVIVATHDEVFANQMLKSMPGEKLKAYKMSKWSENGPVLEEIH